MFIEVIREEAADKKQFLYPHVGLSHKWSQEFLENHNQILNPELLYPKILYALAFGASSRFMITGKESALIGEILKHSENSISISIPILFRLSLRLNQGNVYLTLLTIENVLSKHFLHRERELLPVTRRLRSFRRGEGFDNDRFGLWYHFFGMVMYGYVTVNAPFWTGSGLIGSLENLGGLFFNGDRGDQKKYVNLQGGRNRRRVETCCSPGGLA